ncbi:MAG: hypothetical protein D6705_12570 [Deltaproteobacteria bacterium]|nr:MAG: hypothetical protein D6705_12570 [Deltaproteobacteria bacterium]
MLGSWRLDVRSAGGLGMAVAVVACGPTAAGPSNTGSAAGGDASATEPTSTAGTEATAGSGASFGTTDPCRDDPCCGDPCCSGAGGDGVRCSPPPECETNADCPDGFYCAAGNGCLPAPTASGCPWEGETYSERLVLEPTFGWSVTPTITALGPGRVAAFHPDPPGGAITNPTVRIWSISTDPPEATFVKHVIVAPDTKWVVGGDFDGDGIADLVTGQSAPVPGLRFFRGEADGGFTPSDAVFTVDDLAMRYARFVGIVADLVPAHPGEELFFGVSDEPVRAVFQVTDGVLQAAWTADDGVRLGTSAAIGPIDRGAGGVHLVYPTADADAFAAHAYGVGGVFEPTSVPLTDDYDGEGRRTVASVTLSNGEDAVARGWTIHGVPAISFFDGPAEPVAIADEPVDGNFGLVGLDAVGGRPARIAVFANGHLPLTLVVPNPVPSPRVRCVERTFPDLRYVESAMAVDADGDGIDSDLLIVRDAGSHYELVLLLR